MAFSVRGWIKESSFACRHWPARPFFRLLRPWTRSPSRGGRCAQDVHGFDGFARLKAAAHVGVSVIAGDDSKCVTARPPCLRTACRFRSVGWRPRGGGDGACILPDAPDGHGFVHPGEGAVFQLPGKAAVCKVIFRGDDKPRGVFVDAVDNPRAHLPPMPERLSRMGEGRSPASRPDAPAQGAPPCPVVCSPR